MDRKSSLNEYACTNIKSEKDKYKSKAVDERWYVFEYSVQLEENRDVTTCFEC